MRSKLKWVGRKLTVSIWHAVHFLCNWKKINYNINKIISIKEERERGIIPIIVFFFITKRSFLVDIQLTHRQ